VLQRLYAFQKRNCLQDADGIFLEKEDVEENFVAIKENVDTKGRNYVRYLQIKEYSGQKKSFCSFKRFRTKKW